MPSYLFVGSPGLGELPVDLPGDGTRPALVGLEPGVTVVDLDANPDPRYFDEVKAHPDQKEGE